MRTSILIPALALLSWSAVSSASPQSSTSTSQDVNNTSYTTLVEARQVHEPDYGNSNSNNTAVASTTAAASTSTSEAPQRRVNPPMPAVSGPQMSAPVGPSVESNPPTTRRRRASAPQIPALPVSAPAQTNSSSTSSASATTSVQASSSSSSQSTSAPSSTTGTPALPVSTPAIPAAPVKRATNSSAPALPITARAASMNDSTSSQTANSSAPSSNASLPVMPTLPIAAPALPVTAPADRRRFGPGPQRQKMDTPFIAVDNVSSTHTSHTGNSSAQVSSTSTIFHAHVTEAVPQVPGPKATAV